MSKTRLKLAKIQASAKQNPEAELLLFENYLAKIIGHFLKNKQKNKCVCIHEIITVNCNENEDENEKDNIDST